MVLKIDALLSVKRSSYPDDVQYDFVHLKTHNDNKIISFYSEIIFNFLVLII